MPIKHYNKNLIPEMMMEVKIFCHEQKAGDGVSILLRRNYNLIKMNQIITDVEKNYF